MFDVIIVGAGPAGLSAALILGRCRRTVLLCDTGRQRNASSHALHGFLTRDGMPPADFLQTARDQLRPYDSVELRHIAVTDAARHEDHFAVTLADGSHLTARKLLIATGVVDALPEVEGVEALYGRSVFHCPYCDGWEMRDQPLAVYGRGRDGVGLALELTQWSRDLVLCTDGPSGIDDDEREGLHAQEIAVDERPLARLEGHDGRLEHLVFDDGDRLPRRALFFKTAQHQHSDLPERLGCTFNDRGTVQTGRYELTHIDGLYVAGDASKAVQLAVVAASEGAQAAFAINTALLKEDLHRRRQEAAAS